MYQKILFYFTLISGVKWLNIWFKNGSNDLYVYITDNLLHLLKPLLRMVLTTSKQG